MRLNLTRRGNLDTKRLVRDVCPGRYLATAVPPSPDPEEPSGGRADDENGLHLISHGTMDPSSSRACWGELPQGVAIMRHGMILRRS
jgi:hypothetical protein